MGLGNKFFRAVTKLIPSKEVWVDNSRLANYTETGSIQHPFRSIQAAIDGTTGTVTIRVTPQSYTENLLITRSNITICSTDNSAPRNTLTITGQILINLSGNGNVWLAGFTVINPADSALKIIGATDVQTFMQNCTFQTNSAGAHHGCEDINTGDSQIIAKTCIFRTNDVSGGGMGYYTTGGDGDRRFFACNFLNNNQNALVIHLGGSVTMRMFDEDVQGTVEIRDTAVANFNRVLFIGFLTPLIDTTSTAALPSSCSLCTFASGAVVLVSGTGKFTHALNGFFGVEGSFAPTLNGGAGATYATVRGAKNIEYDPSTSIYPFVSTNVQDALDEIAAAIGGGDTDELEFGNRSIQSSTTTRYLDAGITNAGSPTALVQRPANKAGTLQGLVMRHNTPNGNGSPINYTVFVNGVATAITTTLLSTDSTGSDLVNSVVVVATDLIAIEVKKAASVGSSPIDVTGYLEIV